MSGRNVPKKAQMPMTRNRSQGLTSANTNATTNNSVTSERSPSPAIDYSQPGFINNSAAGRRFLEKHLLFVP